MDNFISLFSSAITTNKWEDAFALLTSSVDSEVLRSNLFFQRFIDMEVRSKLNCDQGIDREPFHH